jgi:uncharacterized RDD family membrane protein YckC
MVVAAGAARANDAALLAHGSAERFWVARVYQDEQRGGGYVTDVYARLAGEGRWHQIARLDGRALDAAHRGAQLALLLDTGAWILVSEGTVATGRAVPGARILGIASHGDTLLALAKPEDPPRPTAAASPASAPATQPSRESERLVLLSLGPQGWADAGTFDLAGTSPFGKSDVSLAVVEAVPYVAVREWPRTVHVYRGAPGGAQRVATVRTSNTLTSFKLVGGGPLPVLWTVEAGAGGPAARLSWVTRDGVRAADVALTPARPARGKAAGGTAAATAAFAIEKVRVLYGAGTSLSERAFDGLEARPVGDPVAFALPRVQPLDTLYQWLQPPITVLVLFAIVASIRRRREMQETMEAAVRLPLAPFGRRLLAGLIDALPLLGTAAVAGAVANRSDDPANFLYESGETQAAALAALLFYLVHTTASETFFGRTFGKWCCGLRVVGLDGQRPALGALFIRNLLRLIDLSMMFFPLVMVLYSPLRQRAGDVAAGTLVVLNDKGAETASDADDRAEPASGGKSAGPVELTE